MYSVLSDGCLWDDVGQRLVMPPWELPLWKKVVDDLIPAGSDVFEVGLGLGISGKLISAKAKSHIIAETDISTILLSTNTALADKIIEGDGLTVLKQRPALSLDCILVDDYSIDDPSTLLVLPEFWTESYRTLRKSGRVVAPFCEPNMYEGKLFKYIQFDRMEIKAGCQHGGDLNIQLGYWSKNG